MRVFSFRTSISVVSGKPLLDSRMPALSTCQPVSAAVSMPLSRTMLSSRSW